jgi:hypothetical protein
MKQKTPFLILTVAAIFYAWQLIDYVNFTIDDAFISMRVADNVAGGHGFVYNVGDYVEGYSSWLWVVLLALPLKLQLVTGEGSSSLLWYAKGLSIFFGVATLVALYRFVKQIFRDTDSANIYAAISVLFLASCPPFAAWSMGAMEVTCETFLLVVALYYLFIALKDHAAFALRTTTIASTILGLNALLRPEGIFIALVIAAAFILASPPRARAIRVVTFAIPLIVIFGNFLLWRWNVYGDIVPNTFYAKTGEWWRRYAKGVKYLLAGIGVVGGSSLFVIPAAFHGFHRDRRLLAILFAYLFALTFFIIYSGGDWMPGFRFVVALIPILIVLIELGIYASAQIVGARLIPFRREVILITFLVIAGSMFAGRALIRGQLPNLGTTLYTSSGHALPSHVAASKWLHEHSTGKHSFACGEAGILAYENPTLRFVDLNGLLDKEIAQWRKHAIPFDPNYVLDKKPDFILLYGTQLEGRDRFVFNTADDYMRAIEESPRFAKEYALAARLMAFDIYERK